MIRRIAIADPTRSKRPGYKVGYGRPPKESQFVPGKSGNPKGRPKGSRSVGAILDEIVRRKVSVTEGGKTRRMSVLEVTFRRLATDAMRGEQNAIKLLLSLVDRYGVPGGEPVSTANLHAIIQEATTADEAMKAYLQLMDG